MSNLKKWCENYLEDRPFYVKVCKAVGNRVTVSEGTAQGSMLGTLQYITYDNSLVNYSTHA